MPHYDYRCTACGHEFELFQSMTAPIQRKCPACGKLKLERLIGTGAGVIFKGGGFYETDYRSEAYKKAAEAETKPPGDGAKKTEGAAATSDGSASAPPPPEKTKPETETSSKSSSKSHSAPAKAKAEPAPASKARKSSRRTNGAG